MNYRSSGARLVLCATFVACSACLSSGESVRLAGRAANRPNWEQMVGAASARTTAALHMRVKHLRASNVPASTVLLAIAEKTGLPLGVELAVDDERPPIVTLNVDNESVSSVINRLLLAGKPRYTLECGGAAYRNYVLVKHRTPAFPDLSHPGPRKEPPSYVFSERLTQNSVVARSPADAVRQIAELASVSNRPPNLPVIVPGGVKFPDNIMTQPYDPLEIPIITLSEESRRVRGAINMIALAAAKNWIAESCDDGGKHVVRIRFFDKASEVCPDVSKVDVELE